MAETPDTHSAPTTGGLTPEGERLAAAARERLRNLEQQLEEDLAQLSDDVELALSDLDRREAELQERLEKVARRESETRRQRRKVADQLRVRKAEWLAQRLQERQEASVDTAASAACETEKLSVQNELNIQRRLTDEANEEADRLRAEFDALQTQLQEAQADLENARSEQESVSSANTSEEFEEMQLLLQEAQEELARARQSTSGDEDLKRRLEMAVEEIRELKSEKAELESRATSGLPDSLSISEGFDWETQKQRMLEQLESEDGAALSADDRMTVEGAIQMTDQIVAEKDKHIQELQALLESQSHRGADLAVGAAAIGELMDQDDLIVQERERLIELQEEWREKLRTSEIEISVERAKLARERAELEDRIAALEAEKAEIAAAEPPAAGGDASSGKSTTSRWLARLGLIEKDD